MTKRAAGESSISKGDDGRWHGYVSMGRKADGQRDRRHVSAATRPVVVGKVRELERQRDAGVTAASGRKTVSAWLDHWLDGIAARRVRPRTLESYRSVVRLHLSPALGHHQLARLQPEHLERHYAELGGQGLAAATVLRVHRVLSRALHVALQRGLVARNVATLVDPPTVRQVEVDPLTTADARRVLAAARGQRNAARWTVALSLGLRQSEALGLQWQDVDLDAGTLSVRRGLHRVAGKGLVFEEPKSATSRRTVALPRPLVVALREHRREQAAERLAAGELWEDHGLVFGQVTGRPIDRRADHRAWQKLLGSAGVRAARLHDARHCAATMLLVQGVPARVVMQILGHSTMRVTTDTYQHVVPELAREAADRMGEALWG